jgi:hypothetical protein
MEPPFTPAPADVFTDTSSMAMSATMVFVVLLMALLIDWSSFGHDSLRDRVAFLLSLPAIRLGFDGSMADRWVVGVLGSVIDGAKGAAGDAYISHAKTGIVIGVVASCVFFYAIGCMVPEKWSNKLGPYARLSFSSGKRHRMNYKLWACSAFLGLTADLMNGWSGLLARWSITVLSHITAWISTGIFGSLS